MEKKKQPNVKADANNKNQGTNGTNKILDKNEGNRGKQIQENMRTNEPQPQQPKKQQPQQPKQQQQPQPPKQQSQPKKKQQSQQTKQQPLAKN